MHLYCSQGWCQLQGSNLFYLILLNCQGILLSIIALVLLVTRPKFLIQQLFCAEKHNLPSNWIFTLGINCSMSDVSNEASLSLPIDGTVNLNFLGGGSCKGSVYIWLLVSSSFSRTSVIFDLFSAVGGHSSFTRGTIREHGLYKSTLNKYLREAKNAPQGKYNNHKIICYPKQVITFWDHFCNPNKYLFFFYFFIFYRHR